MESTTYAFTPCVGSFTCLFRKTLAKLGTGNWQRFQAASEGGKCALVWMNEGNDLKPMMKMEVTGTLLKVHQEWGGRIMSGMTWTGEVWRREMLKTGEDGEGWYRTQTWHPGWTREEGDAQDRRRWRRMVQNPDLASWLDKGGGRCSRQEKMEKDGTEPRLGILAGQGRREMLKTGEDGEGWYRTQTWHPGWTREEGDAQDRRRWRRMAQNPDLASWLEKGGGRCSRQEKMEKDGTEPRLGILAGQGRREMSQDRRRWRRMVQNPDLASWLDKGGGRCSRQEKMEKDGTEPRLGILAGQGRREMLKTGEDGEGWHRTQTWHRGWRRRRRRRRTVSSFKCSLCHCPGM